MHLYNIYIYTHICRHVIVCQFISYVKIWYSNLPPLFHMAAVSTRMEKFVVIDLDDATLVTSSGFGTSTWQSAFVCLKPRHQLKIWWNSWGLVFQAFSTFLMSRFRIVNQPQPGMCFFWISLRFQISPIPSKIWSRWKSFGEQWLVGPSGYVLHIRGWNPILLHLLPNTI